MDFFNKHNITLGNVLKFIGIAIGAIIIVALLSSLFRISFSGQNGGFLSRGGGGMALKCAIFVGCSRTKQTFSVG